MKQSEFSKRLSLNFKHYSSEKRERYSEERCTRDRGEFLKEEVPHFYFKYQSQNSKGIVENWYDLKRNANGETKSRKLN